MKSTFDRRTALKAGAALAAAAALPVRAQAKTLRFAAVFSDKDIRADMVRRLAKDVQAELLKQDILTGTSGDPNVVRILAPFVLGSEHVEQLRDALKKIAP